MTKAKPFKCVCEGSDYIEIIFAKSKKAARKIFASLYKLEYHNPDISIKRVKSLAHLNRKDGYILDWKNLDDRLALLSEVYGYGCSYLENTKNTYEDCVYRRTCEPYPRKGV